MQFLQKLANNLPLSMYPELLARIVVSCICGAVIGYERSMRMKAAGIRTHSLIAATAALLMIISKYAFADLTPMMGDVYSSLRGADPARIAAQVISSISFLGAGVIFVKGGSIHGLTTAAGIWATAAVGLAIGAGMYIIGGFAALLVLALQLILHKMSVGDDAYTTREIVLEVKEDAAFDESLFRSLEESGIQIITGKVVRSADQNLQLHLSARMGADFTMEKALELVHKYPEIKSIST